MLPLIMFLVAAGQSTAASGRNVKCCPPDRDGKVKLPYRGYQKGDGPFCGQADKLSLEKVHPHSVCPVSYSDFVDSEEQFKRALHKTAQLETLKTARTQVKSTLLEFGTNVGLKWKCPSQNPHTDIPYAMIGLEHSTNNEPNADALVMASQRPILDDLFEKLNTIGQSTSTKILVFLEFPIDIEDPQVTFDPNTPQWTKHFRHKYKNLVFESAEANVETDRFRQIQGALYASAEPLYAVMDDTLTYQRNIGFMKKMTEKVQKYSSQVSGVVSLHGVVHLKYFGTQYGLEKRPGFDDITNAYLTSKPKLGRDEIQERYDELNAQYEMQRCFDHYYLPNCTRVPNDPLCHLGHPKSQQKRDWTASQKKSQLPPQKFCSQKQPHSKCGR